MFVYKSIPSRSHHASLSSLKCEAEVRVTLPLVVVILTNNLCMIVLRLGIYILSSLKCEAEYYD
jgi:hypothetical protein